jgi:hypothetical protein
VVRVHQANGQELGVRDECVLKGIVGDDEVKQILVKADTNGDGVISRSEFLAAVQAESL